MKQHDLFLHAIICGLLTFIALTRLEGAIWTQVDPNVFRGWLAP